MPWAGMMRALGAQVRAAHEIGSTSLKRDACSRFHAANLGKIDRWRKAHRAFVYEIRNYKEPDTILHSGRGFATNQEALDAAEPVAERLAAGHRETLMVTTKWELGDDSNGAS